MLAGVIQRVNGSSPSASITPFRFWTHCANGMLSECTAFRPSSRSCSFNSTNSEGLSCRLASNSPLSSKHSRIADRRYASLSSCLRMSSRGGRYPSCGDRYPPGKTWAEAKEVELWTRWRRSIRFEGDIRRILEPSQKLQLDDDVSLFRAWGRWRDVPCAWTGDGNLFRRGIGFRRR